MKLLDLFCSAGGTAVGYHRAGFDVTGVDIKPMPRFPFRFVLADALDILADTMFVMGFDVVHTSPPCQGYSVLAGRNGNGHAWPKLIEPLREQLLTLRRPWVIENVQGAPLADPVMLCGTMFDGLRVIRHRLFESNVVLHAPEHGRHPLVFTMDRRKAHYGMFDQSSAFVQVTGGGNATVANKRVAMGIDWMIGRELNEAVPPAYTEHIGKQLAQHLTVDRLRGNSDR